MRSPLASSPRQALAASQSRPAGPAGVTGMTGATGAGAGASAAAWLSARLARCWCLSCWCGRFGYLGGAGAVHLHGVSPAMLRDLAKRLCARLRKQPRRRLHLRVA